MGGGGGGLLPQRITGNKEKEILVGVEQFLLCHFLFMFPNALLDETALYIFNNVCLPHERSQISVQMTELDLTKKKASTEALQAFLPRNVTKCRRFWTLPAPLGIVGVKRRCFIDVDECGIALGQTNKTQGHGYISLRIRKPGHYTRDVKLTILMAVKAGDANLLPSNLRLCQ